MINGPNTVPVDPYFQPVFDQPFDGWHHELWGIIPGQVVTENYVTHQLIGV